MSEHKILKKNHLKYLSLFIPAILIWGISPFIITAYLSTFGGEKNPTWTMIAQVGDSFGSINALFSAFGLIGVIIAIKQEKDIYRKERDEKRIKDYNNFLGERINNYQKLKKIIFSTNKEFKEQITALQDALTQFNKNEHELIPIYKSPSPHLDILSKETADFNILEKFPHNHQKAHEFIIEIKSLNLYLEQYKEDIESYINKFIQQHTQVQEIDNKIQTDLLELKINIKNDLINIKTQMGKFLGANQSDINNFLIVNSKINLNAEELMIKEKLTDLYSNTIKSEKNTYLMFVNNIAFLEEKLRILNSFYKERNQALNNNENPLLVDKKKNLHKAYINLYDGLYILHDKNNVKLTKEVHTIITQSHLLINHVNSMKEQNGYLSKEIEKMINSLENGIEKLLSSQTFLEQEEKIHSKKLEASMKELENNK